MSRYVFQAYGLYLVMFTVKLSFSVIGYITEKYNWSTYMCVYRLNIVT